MGNWLKKISAARHYAAIFRQNRRRLDELRQILADRTSVRVVDRILRAYTSAARSGTYHLRRAACGVCSEYHFTAEDGYRVYGTRNPYFLDLFEYDDSMVLLDGGAYIGDTVELALGELRLPCRRVYAFEPNRESFEKLVLTAGRYGPVVRCFNCGLDDRNARVSFRVDDAGSRIDSEGGEVIDVMDIGEFLSGLGEDAPTFIKLDIEGKEQDVLRRAEGFIRERRPDIAVSVYHRLEDLWEIPLLLHRICPDYRLYIRHQSNYYTETVCYATVRRSVP